MGMRNVTTKLIATALGVMGNLDRPIFDQTGLSGNYDFVLKWTPEPNGPPPSGANVQSDQSGPTFLEALKEQLGIKLESQTGPVDVLVIDHVEQPSEN
jgi:bla regulator protein blaR1